MNYEPILIGEYTSGLQTNRRPFMINSEAWAELDNMWNFRGRMRKKYGYSLKGRLKITWNDLFIIASGGGVENFNLTTISGAPPSALLTKNSIVITDGTTTWTDNGLGQFTGGTGTVNYNTGAVSLSGVAASNVFATFSYFPNLPVMGLRTRERDDLNNEQSIAFDTTYSYRFIGGMWECLPNTFTITNISTGGPPPPNPRVTTSTNHGLTTGDVITISGVTGDLTMQNEVNDKSFVITVISPTTFDLDNYTTTGTYTGGGTVSACETWTGSNSQFFWTTNFQAPGQTRLFWAVNFDGINYTDPMRYYNGTTWTNFTPNLNVASNRTLDSAAIILPYKERLLVFKTRETDMGTPIIFPQRIRWSQIGDPTTATAWQDDMEGLGGFLDVPIDESIVSAGFIRDRIVIYMERSTWELIYTGNELDPFKLRKINTDLGAESRFSTIQFDASLLGVGNVGIHSCNGDSVVRIDDAIPSFVFDIHNGNNGVERVYGIRDYYSEICFWSYPDSRTNPTFPNRMLIYNYRDKNWATWRDSFTCYGYFQRTNDRTWASYTDTTWGQADFQWTSGQGQSRYREIVAGNQNGYVLTFFPETYNVVPSRYLTGATKTGNQVTLTIPDHNFEVGDYISVSGAIDNTNTVFDPLGDPTASPATETIVRITNIPTGGNTVICVVGNTTAFTYLMGGEVTKYDNINMRTKFFTPYWKYGASMQLNHIDFLFDRTRKGEVTYNLYVDDIDSISLTDSSLASNLGNNVVRTRPDDDDNAGFAKNTDWHRAYGWADGSTIQIQLTMSDDQMRDPLINQAPIVFYAMILYTMRVDDIV